MGSITLHFPREELLRLHVVRVRTAGVRRGGRPGLYRRPCAHVGLRRRSAAQLHLAGDAGVPARGRRVEGSPSPWRHRERVTVPAWELGESRRPAGGWTTVTSDGFYLALGKAGVRHLREQAGPMVFHDLSATFGTLAVQVAGDGR